MNTNFLVRTRAAILEAYYFTIAYRNNLIAEYLDRRLQNKKRDWTAYGTFGAGVVPLGKCNMVEATKRTAKFGTVSSTDVEQAAIFYGEKR